MATPEQPRTDQLPLEGQIDSVLQGQPALIAAATYFIRRDVELVPEVAGRLTQAISAEAASGQPIDVAGFCNKIAGEFLEDEDFLTAATLYGISVRQGVT